MTWHQICDQGPATATERKSNKLRERERCTKLLLDDLSQQHSNKGQTRNSHYCFLFWEVFFLTELCNNLFTTVQTVTWPAYGYCRQGCVKCNKFTICLHFFTFSRLHLCICPKPVGKLAVILTSNRTCDSGDCGMTLLVDTPRTFPLYSYYPVQWRDCWRKCRRMCEEAGVFSLPQALCRAKQGYALTCLRPALLKRQLLIHQHVTGKFPVWQHLTQLHTHTGTCFSPNTTYYSQTHPVWPNTHTHTANKAED